MTTISVQIDGDEAVLLIDGKAVAPDAQVTLPADAIARLAHANLEYGRRTVATEPGPYHRNRVGFRPPEVPA